MEPRGSILARFKARLDRFQARKREQFMFNILNYFVADYARYYGTLYRQMGELDHKFVPDPKQLYSNLIEGDEKKIKYYEDNKDLIFKDSMDVYRISVKEGNEYKYPRVEQELAERKANQLLFDRNGITQEQFADLYDYFYQNLGKPENEGKERELWTGIFNHPPKELSWIKGLKDIDQAAYHWNQLNPAEHPDLSKNHAKELQFRKMETASQNDIYRKLKHRLESEDYKKDIWERVQYIENRRKNPVLQKIDFDTWKGLPKKYNEKLSESRDPNNPKTRRQFWKELFDELPEELNLQGVDQAQSHWQNLSPELLLSRQQRLEKYFGKDFSTTNGLVDYRQNYRTAVFRHYSTRHFGSRYKKKRKRYYRKTGILNEMTRKELELAYESKESSMMAVIPDLRENRKYSSKLGFFNFTRRFLYGEKKGQPTLIEQINDRVDDKENMANRTFRRKHQEHFPSLETRRLRRKKPSIKEIAEELWWVLPDMYETIKEPSR